MAQGEMATSFEDPNVKNSAVNRFLDFSQRFNRKRLTQHLLG
jgi:hypothetical protein